MNKSDLRRGFNPNYPSVEDLAEKASKRIPGFAYEYLIGGCNDEFNLARNSTEIQEVTLMPQYLSDHRSPTLSTDLFGQQYGAPFGIAPIGLQGLIWPNSPEVLARAALKHNVPFILSTVSTTSIERIGEITDGKFWFQLYHPAENRLRDDILNRAKNAGCEVLVILADTPSFGFRYRDIRNGLSMPPKMSMKNVFQILKKPTWAINTLLHGRPGFAVLEPYMPKKMDLSQLGRFMDQTFDGRLNEEKIKAIRDLWGGKLVVKGIVNEQDAEKVIKLGVDGIIVSNHGGRQLDAGESTIKPLKHLAARYGDQITVMIDSGIKSGPDIARCMASGAKFTFMGRTFMHGVGALGAKGGDHTIAMLKLQLQQVLEQLGCEKVQGLPSHLASCPPPKTSKQ